MKIVAMVVGMLAGCLSCTAQPASTNSVDDSRFLICLESEPVCTIAGLAPTNSAARKYQGPDEAIARRLQTYFLLLSGCKVPIEHLDSPPPENAAKQTILLRISGPTASGSPEALVKLYSDRRLHGTPALSIEDREIGRGLKKLDGKITETNFPRRLLKEALDAFGQKCFGVPVSAIDDTNFNWSAHHTNTLAISYADFQPIQFPPANPATQAK